LPGAADAWAGITFVASATSSGGSTLTGSMTITMPVGVPSGDVCVAQLAASGDNVIAVPPGWTKIREDINGHNATLGLYWHVSIASEPSSYTWTTGGGVFYDGGIACYAGVSTAAPIDPGAPDGIGTSGSGTEISAPSITTQSGGDLIVGGAMVAETSFGQGDVINLPGTFTTRWSFTDSSASFIAAAAGDWIQDTAGPTGGLGVTTSNGQSSDALIAQQAALRPANPPPPPPPPQTGGISFLASTFSSSGSNLTGSLTLGMPASIPAGVICIADLASTGSNVFTVPAGWNAIRADQYQFQATQALYWHLTGSGEQVNYTWTTGGGVYFEGWIGCYAGVNTAAPIDPGAPEGSGAVAGGNGGVAAPSITTQTGGDLIFVAAMDAEGAFGEGATVNLPAPFTSRWSATDTIAPFLAAAVGDELQTSAGGTGALSVTTTNGQSGDGLIVAQVTLQPANPPPPPPPPSANQISFVGSAVSSGGSLLLIKMPLTMPSTATAGDVCVAQLAVDAANHPVVPAGWTKVRDDVNGLTAMQGIYWHVAGSNEPATYTWHTLLLAASFTGAIGCYSGISTAAPVDPGAPQGSGATAVGTSSISAPPITTSSNDDLVIGAFMVSPLLARQGLALGLPGALSVRWSTASAYLAMTAGDQIQSAAGSTGFITAADNQDGSQDRLIAQQIAFQPAAQAADPPPVVKSGHSRGKRRGPRFRRRVRLH
ncbi:MAG: hypothetical protein ACREQN_02550, partial [Candidatus Binataceae bacterium]